jgi:hypothetical protein
VTQGAPNESQALEQILVAAGIDIRSAMPGNVTRIAGTSPARVDVQPTVGRADRSSSDADRYDPVIKDVVVAWPLCGNGGLSFDLAKGDAVLLVFCDRSIVEWVAGGGSGKVPAVDRRTHDITDALAFPIKTTGAAPGGLLPTWLASYLKVETGNTMTLSATLGKLGAAAVDGLIKGTTFNNLNTIMLNLVLAGFTSAAAAFTAGATYYGTAAAAWGTTGTPPGAGSGLADQTVLGVPTMGLCNAARPNATAAATACTAAATACTAAAVGIGLFNGLTSFWTSTTWKVQ